MEKKRLSEAETKKLLERASELDVERAQSLDPAAVREIAIEAGISPAAIDAAVQEHLEGRVDSAKPRNRLAPFLTVGKVALILIGIFVVFAFLRSVP